MKNRVITRVIIIVTILVLCMPVTSFGFSDVPEDSSIYKGIKMLTDKGYINGYPDGSFKPQGYITRAEYITMTNKILALNNKVPTESFIDVGDKDWFYNDVLIALMEGYILGYSDKTFKPNNNISKEETCVILDRVLELPAVDESKVIISDKVSDWALGAVKKVIGNGLMKLGENNVFYAKNMATRAEVSSAYAVAIKIQESDGLTMPTSGAISGGAISGSGGNTSTADYNDMIKRTIEDLNDLTNKLTTQNQKDLINEVIKNMNSYLADNSFNIESGVEKAKQIKNKMTKDEKDELMSILISNMKNLSEVIELKSRFGF